VFIDISSIRKSNLDYPTHFRQVIHFWCWVKFIKNFFGFFDFVNFFGFFDFVNFFGFFDFVIIRIFASPHRSGSIQFPC